MSPQLLPAADPIPLPAPVWLFKFLELLTLALHFVALHLLLGGLIFATVWALWGHFGRRPVLRDASGAVSFRLPIIMTYVINLGVPPLLFTQVLYGRALYTSSILMGTYWISVIFLLAICYSCLYVMSKATRTGQMVGWFGLVALLLAVKIAMVYTANMTLMLRPDAWLEMYRADSLGRQLPSGDPTILPRWLFMILGSVTVGGVGAMLLGLNGHLSADTSLHFRRWGARLAALGVLMQVAAGYAILATQPAGVREALASSSVYQGVLAAWGLTALLLLVVAVVSQARAAQPAWLLPIVASLLAILNVGAYVVYRDGIRDYTLAAAGYDVWAREVFTNWQIVIIFFVVFAAGLAVLGWMLSYVVKARRVKESYV